MNRDNTQRLSNEFPWLFRGRQETLQTNLMPFGFACGDGWFALIHELCTTLSQLATEEGRTADNWPKAVQVKEKFGTLRFYADNLSEAMDEAVDRAEERSAQICEVCGKAGRLRTFGGWHTTLCGYHASTTYRMGNRAVQAVYRLRALLDREEAWALAGGDSGMPMQLRYRRLLGPGALASLEVRPESDTLRREFADLRDLLASPDLENWIAELREDPVYGEVFADITREATEGYPE